VIAHLEKACKAGTIKQATGNLENLPCNPGNFGQICESGSIPLLDEYPAAGMVISHVGITMSDGLRKDFLLLI
jgi:hypothetical protein